MSKEIEDLKRTMTFYCNLMEEIKIRDRGMGAMMQAGNAPAQIVYESCYLQLRMTCELIALGCLIVHGDIEATKTRRMRETWEADQIIKQLSKIHAPFYPQPVQKEHGNKHKLVAVAGEFLSKSELISLYGKCGDRLHRGTVKNARHHISPESVTYDQIDGWRSKVANLLNHHWIKIFGSDDQIGVQMGGQNERVSWNYWRSMGPSPE